MALYKKIHLNKIHDVFFTGDLHGMYDNLLIALELLNYKTIEVEQEDIKNYLFTVGDMIDRGEKSYDLAQMFRFDPDKFSTLGNHEGFAINAIKKGKLAREIEWMQDGGEWSKKYSRHVLNDLINYFHDHLPVALEIEMPDGKRIGITHAGTPKELTWQQLVDILQNPENASKYNTTFEKVLNACLSDCKNVDSKDDFVVEGIDVVLHGHTYHEEATILGNRIYIDTRASMDAIYQNFAMTILQYVPDNKGDLLGMFKAYRFKRNEDGIFGYEE